ncbi:AAA family ATPase [Paenibacillus chitinolyticus]|uniref:AAA family ATPase n=1 Tax=Paenibacillus chitinolyticus TaxID=79263 RepID=UPI0026E4E645|nr:AAA family ATPase [Paenibacillus chitinolyticus]GKS14744.1 AAA family ATPase [Paenibacillus chitinolyticus]
MKNIILERITLRNFKGFKEFVLNTAGGSVSIYGNNATGKTTLFDAFVWLLFGKDSQNRTDFEIKALDEQGHVKDRHLQHEVEAVFSIDGRPRTLRRVLTEKWVTTRGQATPKFDGHKTEYFVDGVPVKQTEYKAEVDSIIEESVFKLLTNPAFFNEQLKWEERRKILFEITGDVSDEEVIGSSQALSRLPEILEGRSIENHKKVIAAKRSEIKKELDTIPVRINEAERSKPDTTDLDAEVIQDDIQTLRDRIREGEEKLVRIQEGGEIAALEKHLRSVEAHLTQIQNRQDSAAFEQARAQRDRIAQLQDQCNDVSRKVEELKYQFEQNNLRLTGRMEAREKLRDEYHEVNGQTFTPPHESECPTCGQSLPAEQIQAAHDKTLEDFNRKKSSRLEEILSLGTAATTDIANLETYAVRLNRELVEQTEILDAKRAAVLVAETKLAELRKGVEEPAPDPDYVAKQQEARDIQDRIVALRSSNQGSVEQQRMELSKLRIDVLALERQLVRFEQVDRISRRIEELQEEERRLAAEFERLEGELYLMDEFTRAKVGMLESRINSKFKRARFRLFKTQINGGLEECCETLDGGVPYGGGLNNAARINVGLDIINTLGEHYGFSAPIFIDNAESVTELIAVNSQVIRLVVPPTFDSLPIETLEALSRLHEGDPKERYEAARDAWKTKYDRLQIERESVSQEAV